MVNSTHWQRHPEAQTAEASECLINYTFTCLPLKCFAALLRFVDEGVVRDVYFFMSNALLPELLPLIQVLIIRSTGKKKARMGLWVK